MNHISFFNLLLLFWYLNHLHVDVLMESGLVISRGFSNFFLHNEYTNIPLCISLLISYHEILIMFHNISFWNVVLIASWSIDTCYFQHNFAIRVMSRYYFHCIMYCITSTWYLYLIDEHSWWVVSGINIVWFSLVYFDYKILYHLDLIVTFL